MKNWIKVILLISKSFVEIVLFLLAIIIGVFFATNKLMANVFDLMLLFILITSIGLKVSLEYWLQSER